MDEDRVRRSTIQIDDLKKEKRIYFEELKSKKNFESEVENCRSEYKKLLKENEELISSSEDTIFKMKKEHEELKKRNETLKQLCNNIQVEKSEMEKNLNASIKKLNQFEENQNLLNSILSKKYNRVVDEFRNWAGIIDSKEDSFAKVQLLEMENETLKSEKDKLNISNQSLTKDKENMELEMVELNDRIKKICIELDAANADRDKMLNNLEKVSLETKRLIENSEVLTQELGILKEERASMEHSINVLNNEKQSLLKIVSDKQADLDQLASQLESLEQEKMNSSMNNPQEANLVNLDDNTTQTNNSIHEDSLEKERSVNIELLSLQNDLKAFSAEIESYKVIVKESEAKLQEALGSISEKEYLLKSQEQNIIELTSKVNQLESLQVAIAKSLSETREQLVIALEKIEDIDRMKDDLQQECLLKDEEFLVACHKLEVKECFIKDIIDRMEGLRLELNSVHKIDSLEEEFDTENSGPEDYIKGLKKCMDAITCKMYHNYRKEIESLKEIINEYQENNEALAIDNNKLSKQAKDLLNEQANFDSGLVLKLKTFKENLLHQLKEKQVVIANLEKDVSLLKDQLEEKDNLNQRVEADKNDLKCIHDKMVSDTSLEIKTLSEKLYDIEMRYGESMSSSFANNELIINLKDKINELNSFIVTLENRLEDSNMKHSHLTGVIHSLNSKLEKENKELKNLILNMNSELLEGINEVTAAIPTDEVDFKKGFSEIELYHSLMGCLSKELDRLKACQNLAKEDIDNQLSILHEEKSNLSGEVTMMTRKIEELQSNISSLEKNNSQLTSVIDSLNSKLDKENKELKNIILNMNSALLEDLNEVTTAVPSDEVDIKKGFSKLELHRSLIGCLSKELDRLKACENLAKEEIKNQISMLNEEKSNLSSEVTMMTRKIEELQSNISSLEKNNSHLAGVIDSLNSKLEKKNKELKNIILNMNSALLEDLNEVTAAISTDKVDIKKGFSEIEIHCSLIECLSKELDRLKASENLLKEEINKQISVLNEEKSNLSGDVTMMARKREELQSNISNLEKTLSVLVKICLKKEVPLRSEELEQIIELLPNNMIEISDDLKVLNSIQSDLESNENKIVGLESLLQKKEAFIETELGKKDSVIANLKEEINSLKDKVDQVSNLNDSLNSDLSNFKENLERLRSEYNCEKDVLLDKNNKIQNELKDCKELLDFKSLELRENNRIWAGRFSSLKVALIGLNKTRKEIKNQFQSIESSFNSFLNGIKEPLQEKVDLVVQNAVAASKAELIREMHQMNQALKERGELISKLEFTITDCHTKMKQLTLVSEKLQSELVQVKTELRREEDAVKEKDQLIKQLEGEIEQLKESHESTAQDNDVLSTSTISKTEEHSRLKDVEDSFEDRYMKLKLIAVKLKKRAADLGHSLDSERVKFATEKTELQEKIASMSMAVKNAQKIQELFDESLDERDKLKKDNDQLKNTVEELKKNELSLNSKISTLEASNQNIPVMKKHIDSLNTNIKELKSEVQRLQLEVKAEVIKYEEIKKNCNKLETTVQELTSQLEQAKQQGKNNTVLELEMKNYEKIIADLSSQLNIERAAIKSLRSENEALSNVKIGLHEQISILEKQIAVEQQRIQDTQDQLATFQSRFEEKNIQIETLNSSIGELKKHLSEEKSKNEALTMEMSAVTSEYSKKEMVMLSKISSTQDEIRSLETSLQSTKQELATAKHEIDHLNEEYESYKLRAQTILAKKKGDLVTHAEKEAKEECDRLKRECAGLEERLDSAMSEIDTLNTRLSSLNLEKARSDKKYEEMRTALQQKLLEHDVLGTEVYNLKMANEIAIEQLKAELTKKKNEYQAELSHHKKVIDDLVLEFKQKEEENVNKDKIDNSGYSLSNFPESILPSSEREDGEGSESVPSPKTRRLSGVVPLDVLLNSPDESKVNVLQEQVEKLQKDLGRSEVRSRHLASLLSEAEKDSARNLHQNKVLKEELRRLERALERQPHVANTEYLKNVIFKFVTLPNGDERSRLVPVLDTLLKFSPEETHKLGLVAKGEALAGWGSYLQSWTGL
nr:GRIP and coiled-coil domain-containing protein 2 [Halyomorpha halys]